MALTMNYYVNLINPADTLKIYKKTKLYEIYEFIFTETNNKLRHPMVNIISNKNTHTEILNSVINALNMYKNYKEDLDIISRLNREIDCGNMTKTRLETELNSEKMARVNESARHERMMRAARNNINKAKNNIQKIAFMIAKTPREEIYDSVSSNYNNASTLYDGRLVKDNPEFRNCYVECDGCKQKVSFDRKCDCVDTCTKIDRINKSETNKIQATGSTETVYRDIAHFQRCRCKCKPKCGDVLKPKCLANKTNTLVKQLVSKCQTDHSVPQACGGDHSIENLNPLEFCCNTAKGDRFLIEELYRYATQKFNVRYHRMIQYTVCYILCGRYIESVPNNIKVIFDMILKNKTDCIPVKNQSRKEKDYILLISSADKLSAEEISQVNQHIQEFKTQEQCDILTYFCKIMTNTYRLEHPDYYKFLHRLINDQVL